MTKLTKQKLDHEIADFEESLLRSIDQAKRGEYAAINTPEQIKARRVGRPVGSVKSAPKVSTTIRLSPEVIERFRASGDGWQTRVDAALKDWLNTHSVT